MLCARSKKKKYKSCEKVKKALKQNFKPRFLVNNTVHARGKKNMKRGWTMVLCFSRSWCVKPFFADFERLEFDRSKCHLLIYANTNNPMLDELLIKKAKRYMQTHKQKYGKHETHKAFASVRLFKSFRKYGGLVYGQKLDFHASKLPTIAAMQNDIAGMITTYKFFMLEDDTLPPPLAVKRMFRKLERSKKTALVSGVEPTRSPILTDKVRLGIYKIVWKDGRMAERISFDPKLRGFRQCDATGWYCLAAKTEAWLKAQKMFNKELPRHITAEPNWAIDTLWTNAIHRLKYKVYADFETPCYHMQVVGPRIFNWAIDKAVIKMDYWIEKYKVYARGVDL